MPIVLRDYQKESVSSIIAQWRTVRSTLLVLYTGGGKTIIFADLIHQCQPKRTLVIAHREELIFQAKHKIEDSTGILCDVEMADLAASTYLYEKKPVVIATVQTLVSGRTKKRMERFNPMDFGLIIIDECHHSTASTYRKILDYFIAGNPDIKIAGFTATPQRSDKEALGQIFESVAARFDILDGIESGWLCDITQQFVSVGTLDYSHIKTVAGDLNQSQLASVMEAEENIAGVCQPSLEVIYGLPPKTLTAIPVPEWTDYLSKLNKAPRRTIVFTASVAHAEACCNIFNRAMPNIAEWVCGKTAKQTRREMLLRFSTGETPVMVNCGVLTEGYDNPHVEVIVMGRPTKSETLYRQMVGRSTRPLPGVVDGPETSELRKGAIAASAKPFCRIIDFVGNSGKHKLVSCMDILGGKISEQAKDRAVGKAKEEGKPVRVSRALSKAEVDLDHERMEKAKERKRQEEARKAYLVPKSNFTHQNISPFELGQLMKNSSGKSRDGRQFSEPQKKRLLMNGVDPNAVNYRQGQAVIAKILSRPTESQKRVLLRAGYSPSELTMSCSEASKLIDKVKANGWRRVREEIYS